MFKRFSYIFPLALILVLFSCKNSYQSLQKDPDLEKRLTAAKTYYDKGAYDKAMPLFEGLITIYKGTKSIDEIYYLYAMCHYNMANYLIAGFHFKNIHDNYPLSPYAEECLYMAAFCDYSMSADIPLDQTYTQKAIDGFQLFINSYPGSDKITEANQLIDQMRRKLEIKALNAAELYLRMGQYKAAATSFGNILTDYPDTRDDEKISFLIVKSTFLYADNSIITKQAERFQDAVKAYNLFKKKYPASTYMDEATKYFDQAQKNLQEL